MGGYSSPVSVSVLATAVLALEGCTLGAMGIGAIRDARRDDVVSVENDLGVYRAARLHVTMPDASVVRGRHVETVRPTPAGGSATPEGSEGTSLDSSGDVLRHELARYGGVILRHDGHRLVIPLDPEHRVEVDPHRGRRRGALAGLVIDVIFGVVGMLGFIFADVEGDPED
jgi:hypothetical protein